jgi:5-hydroxyisourate hydrolase-like protein (transthyretin family)
VTPNLRAVAIVCGCALTLHAPLPGQSRAATDQAGGRSYQIAGVVVDANSGARLDHVEVVIAPAGAEQNIAATTTGEDGGFVFDDLQTGKYRLVASRRGYLTAAYEEHQGSFFTAIVTGPDSDTSHLRFQLSATAILSGSVIDDAGDPVAGAQVTLFRQNSAAGPGSVIRMKTDMADDVGFFEFSRLEPGVYFLSASARPWYAFHPQPRLRLLNGTPQEEEAPKSPLDVAYPMTFYAATTDSDAATPISLQAGDHPQISFAMHAVAAVQLRVKLPQPATDSPGRPPQGFYFPMLTQSVFGTTDNINPNSMSMNTVDGQSFATISGLAPGEYTLEFQGGNGQGHGATPIDLSGDQVLDSSSVAAGVDVSGSLTMGFGAKAPNDLSVTLALVNGRRRGIGQKVSENDGFTLHDVAPGLYELIVTGGGRQLPVLHIRAAGREIEGGRIQIGSEPVTLAATTAEGLATVNGFVKRNGQGLGGAMVVLVPRHPAANPYLFRRDQSNSDGSFSMWRVVPGQYTLIAIEDGWELEWAREGVLQKYLAQGMQLDIREDTSKIDLSEAIEVQAR